MTRRAPQKPPQHIAASLVRGQHAVADHERGAADMVGDDAQGNVRLCGFLIVRAGDLRDLVGNVHHRIHIEQRSHVLAHAGKALQTHAGVDVLLLQLGIIAVAIIIELREHDVPDLDVAVAVAADGAAGFAAAVLLAAVIINFGAGTARAGAVLPEIVLLAEAEDMALGNADHIAPDGEGLVVGGRRLIACKDRRIQPIRLKVDPLGAGQEFPRPVDGLFLEVVTEREVAQHLKIGAVAGSVADVLNIAGTDALLAGGDPVTGRLLLAGKVGLHGCHAGVDQQQRGIVLGDQGKAGQTQMVFGLKEVQEHFPQLVETVVLGLRHNHFLHFYVNFLIFDCKPGFQPERSRRRCSAVAFLPKNKMLRPGHRGEALLHGTTLIIPHPWGHLSHR